MFSVIFNYDRRFCALNFHWFFGEGKAVRLMPRFSADLCVQMEPVDRSLGNRNSELCRVMYVCINFLQLSIVSINPSQINILSIIAPFLKHFCRLQQGLSIIHLFMFSYLY